MRASLVGMSLLLLLLSAGGCSTTQTVARPTNLEDFVRIVQEEGGVDVVVDPLPNAAPDALQSPPPDSVRLLRVSADGITVERPDGPRLLQLEDVRGYDVTRPGTSAAEGAVIGLLAGVTVGAMAGFLVGSDPPCDPNEFLGCAFHLTAGDKAMIGGAAGGLTGILTGAVIGAAVGHTDRYVF